uniref:Anaphase-promoting complex subunit 7 n=1 Tax=Ananas comosus var. bracteatus TaxID=296719 RepID=A0A6V7QL44_ANACO|nr:unnamed protein product [Ananas comosus var. bracteatus]
MEVPKDQMSTLLDNGLFDSAQMLGCFLVSSAGANIEASPSLKAEYLVLQGDALFGEKEFRRALNMYKQALQHCKSIPRQATSNSRNSLSTSSRSSSPNSLSVSTINDNEVKFKITLCHCSLNEHRAALVEMEGIPLKARTLRMNLTLGKLYRVYRNNRASIACYKDCLRHCPYILEAVTALAELGVSSKEILLLFSQTPVKSGRLLNDNLDTQRWLNAATHFVWIENGMDAIVGRWCTADVVQRVQRYVEAQCCIASNDYKGGLDIFSELLQRFPNNVHILLETAKVEAIIGRNDEAIMNFEKVRFVDPYVLTYMDENICRPLCIMERKDERRALSFAEKSLRTDDRHIAGYIMKGNLCMSLNRPDTAVTAFRGAQELRADLRSYQGLVRAYLALSKSKEALFTAREAMKVMHQSAKALKLVGDVHASNSSGREKARKFYESALRLEPGFLGAALALADLHVVEGRNKEAVSLLERYLRDWADDSLHVKLAQVFAATNMLSDALSHYQAALRINPQNEAAKKGLERLEKQMKGMDPDAPEEEEEIEAEDAEGDQEDTELL